MRVCLLNVNENYLAHTIINSEKDRGVWKKGQENSYKSIEDFR